MVYAVYRDYNGHAKGGVLNSWDEYFSDPDNPQTEESIICLISDRAALAGSYEDKKACIRNAGIDYLNSFSEISLSYGEIVTMQDYFTKMGRRFGLINEFRENCIL